MPVNDAQLFMLIVGIVTLIVLVAAVAYFGWKLSKMDKK